MRFRRLFFLLSSIVLLAVCSFGLTFFRTSSSPTPPHISLHIPPRNPVLDISTNKDSTNFKDNTHSFNHTDYFTNLTFNDNSPMKIAIIALFDDQTKTPNPSGGRYLNVVALSLENKKAYADRHNYSFFVDNHMWDKSRPVAWSKLLALRERLKEFHWVMWVDIDTLFMNMRIKLESLIDNKYDLVVSKDRNGLNSGVMLFRSSNWSINFLTECYSQKQFLQQLDIYEQRSIVHVLNNPKNANHVKYLPQKMMNSYSPYHRNFGHQVYSDGDFIIHFAGCRFIAACRPNADKMMKDYSDLSKRINTINFTNSPTKTFPTNTG